MLERYVGRYELRPKSTVTVTRVGETLFAQLTGQERFRLYAMSDREFYYKVVEAQVTFQTDPQGRATALILHQNGVNSPAKRIGEGAGGRTP